VIILLIGRGDSYVVPRGGTRIEPYDTLLLFGNPEHLRSAVERVLAPPTGAIHTAAEMDNLGVLPATTDERLLNQQVVIVGHGRVGRWVREGLSTRGVPMVVVDKKRSIVEKLRAEGLAAVRGDATSPMTLAQAHVARASVLVVTIPQMVGVRQIVDNARGLNGDIRILVRADRESDAALVQDERAITLVYAEREAADSLVRRALGSMRERADGVS
jgi:CPA2 family monovalent cation:H+ antiporter-2